MINLSELKEKNVSELKQLCVNLKKSSFELKLQKSLGQKISLGELRKVKKNIAQVKTLIVQKELAE